jgi:hypothetical protein
MIVIATTEELFLFGGSFLYADNCKRIEMLPKGKGL